MKYFVIFYSAFLLFSCAPAPSQEKQDSNTLISEHQGEADQKSADIAAKVMERMGGQEKWEATRVVAWNFFGARDLIWDKWTGNVRIDFPRAKSIFVVNINSGEGKVWRDREVMTHPDSLDKYLAMAKSIWINDSYWLTMPFKLRDPGVKLIYIGEDTTAAGDSAEVLEMTFEGVGNTPENKYRIHVTKSDGLIKQWSFFKEASQDEPSTIWPWDNYKDFNGILLSANRSDGKGPKDVRVYDKIPDDVFEKLEYSAF